MLVNLSYSFNPLQIILQIAVDRPVENPRKRTENVKMAPIAPQQFYWRVRGQNGSLLYGRDNLFVVTYDQLILTQIQVISKLYKVTTCIMTVENDGIYLPNVILVRCPKTGYDIANFVCDNPQVDPNPCVLITIIEMEVCSKVE